MNINKRKEDLIWLGKQMGYLIQNKKVDSILDDIFTKTSFDDYLQRIEYWNSWHTKETTLDAMLTWSKLLTENEIDRLIGNYEQLLQNKTPKSITVIANFETSLSPIHDFILVLLSGNNYNGFDKEGYGKLLELFTVFLVKKNPEWEDRIKITDQRLINTDAILAYNSDTKFNLLEKYLSKYPKLIRNNTRSIAIIDGNETIDEMRLLAKDIFTYFGLSNRNVSKIFIPQDYNIANIYKAMDAYNHLINHNTYANNYEYNRSIYLFGKIKHFDNGFLLLKEDESISSPTGVLHFEYYTDIDDINKAISKMNPLPQRVLSNSKQIPQTIRFGEVLTNSLSDFDNNMDVLEFLSNLV